jgi:hypothetical protein
MPAFAQASGRAVGGTIGPDMLRIPPSLQPLAALPAKTLDALPVEVRAELVASTKRLASVRKPADLRHVAEAEIGRLSRTIVPLLAAHPLPVQTTKAAKLAAGSSAAAAASFAAVNEFAVFATAGVAAPSLTAAFTALLAAFVVEVWAATSLRVHQVAAAGRTLDHALLADEVTAAVLGTNVLTVRQLAGLATAKLAKRVGKRIGASLIPLAGVAVDSWGATRTVRAISRMDVADHPAAALAE